MNYVLDIAIIAIAVILVGGLIRNAFLDRISKIDRFRSMWYVSEALLSWRTIGADIENETSRIEYITRFNKMNSRWLLVTPLFYTLILGRGDAHMLLLSDTHAIKTMLDEVNSSAPEMFDVMKSLYGRNIPELFV